MKALIWLSLSALLTCLLCCTCNTLNVGTPPSGFAPIITGINFPEEMKNGREAVWEIEFTSGTPPYTIEIDMGGGASVDVPEGTPATPPFTTTFTMLNPNPLEKAVYTCYVTVTDSWHWKASASIAYFVQPSPDEPPLVESAVYATAQHALTVTVDDADDGAVLVEVN